MKKSNRGEKTYFFRFDAEKKKQTTSSSLGKEWYFVAKSGNNIQKIKTYLVHWCFEFIIQFIKETAKSKIGGNFQRKNV
jgi:hypothetical protein